MDVADKLMLDKILVEGASGEEVLQKHAGRANRELDNIKADIRKIAIAIFKNAEKDVFDSSSINTLRKRLDRAQYLQKLVADLDVPSHIPPTVQADALDKKLGGRED